MQKLKKIFAIQIILICCFYILGNAQHRGDNLAFQGLAVPDGNGVKALAMGGAYTAIPGGVQSIFWNPAGLAETKQLEIYFQANWYKKMWRENQVYRPSRQFVVLSFILDGLYVPDPAYNGIYDYEVFKNNPNYTVKEPLLGVDYFSKKAADWQKEKQKFLLDNFALAIPFKLKGKHFVASAAYYRKNQVLDYDRNHTHLVPHLGYSLYEGLIPRIEEPADSTRVYWSDYERKRLGAIWNTSLAIAIQLNKHINLGIGFTKISGKTNDFQALRRIGFFDLVSANVFSFTYDTLNTQKTGPSEFKGISYNVGILFNFKHINVGFKLISPYTLKRKWKYENTRIYSKNSETNNAYGEDKMTVPLPSYAIGICFKPTNKFHIAVDMQNTNYSRSEFSFAINDTTHRKWVDQNLIGVGIEYKPWKWLSVLGGYRILPEVFVPDGAAIKDRGPYSEGITLGLSIKAFLGWFEIACEIRRLKYYDSYYSNTNYVMETLDRLIMGYKLTF